MSERSEPLGGLGATPPVGSRGGAPGRGARGRSPRKIFAKIKYFSAFLAIGIDR